MYGPFKTQFLKNLDLIVEARLDKNKSLLLPPKIMGLPLFGGVDRETGFKVETGAFQKAFISLRASSSLEKGWRCNRGWNNPQVMKSIGDGNKHTDLLTIQSKQQMTLPTMLSQLVDMMLSG